MINALIASGISTKEFEFLGFLPINKKLRKNKLEEIKNANKTVILYEAPHKLLHTLEDLKEIINDRKIVLARKLKKIHEEFIRGDINLLLDKAEEIKGEIVLIIEANKNEKENDFAKLSIEEQYNLYKEQGLDKKDIIKKIAKNKNVNKNEIYQKFIDID